MIFGGREQISALMLLVLHNHLLIFEISLLVLYIVLSARRGTELIGELSLNRLESANFGLEVSIQGLNRLSFE